MRLIDADALQKHFEKIKKESARLVETALILGVQLVIDTQQTAYNVDKIVEQLEEEHINCFTTGDYKYNDAIDKAIEIVKAGVEEGNTKTT